MDKMLKAEKGRSNFMFILFVVLILTGITFYILYITNALSLNRLKLEFVITIVVIGIILVINEKKEKTEKVDTEAKCPHCGADVEFLVIDDEAECPECGEVFGLSEGKIHFYPAHVKTKQKDTPTSWKDQIVLINIPFAFLVSLFIVGRFEAFFPGIANFHPARYSPCAGLFFISFIFFMILGSIILNKLVKKTRRFKK